MKITIRQAKDIESNILTAISFAAKKYWNYPEEYFTIWKEELTITSNYINDNIVFLAEVDEKVVGYFSIVEIKEDIWTGKVLVRKGFWLEHIFIAPDFIGKRIGLELISFIRDLCRKRKIACLRIYSDPNAKGFYDRIGARYIGESPSSIEGRTVSLFELNIYGTNSGVVFIT